MTTTEMAAETEILKELLQTQKDLAQQIYKQAEDFSNYKNSQEIHNFKMMAYLQDDPLSNKEGLVSKVDKIDEKVSNLETELEKKALELETIQALSVDMERIVKQSETPGDKNLSLMDSVLVGDALFNGDKIDKQVVNDPKAIAKAAIEAYKAGRTDVKSVELDF